MIQSTVFRKDYVLRQYRDRAPVPRSDVSGWAWTIPFLAAHDRVAFEPGLTILFGPNGSGKSTILNLLAGPACCLHYGEGGVPRMTGPYEAFDLSLRDIPDIADPRERYLTALHAYRGVRIPMGRADVEWDGAPVFFQDFRGAVAPPRGLYTAADTAKHVATSGHSSGESAQLLLESGLRYLEDLARTHDAAEFRSAIDALSRTEAPRARGGLVAQRMTEVDAETELRKHLDRTRRNWRDISDGARLAWRDYMQTMPIGDRVSALLDEPDAHLSIPAQAALWRRLEQLAAHVQLIVATHSPFALGARAAVIEMVPGYAVACRAALGSLAQAVR